MRPALRRLIRAAALGAVLVVLAGSVTPTAAWAHEDPVPHTHKDGLGVDEPCTDVEAVWARGSGEDLGDGRLVSFAEDAADGTIEDADDDPAFDVFTDILSSRLDAAPEGFTYRTLEIGRGSGYGGYDYPAENVSNVFNGNAFGAWVEEHSLPAMFDAAPVFDYRDSVRQGRLELSSYLVDRADNCPRTRFVLAGFSQGAQVVGEVYTLEDLPNTVRERLIFTALFGDPKLFLPEGLGDFPPACLGIGLSQYRRTIGNCAINNGSLGGRFPYVPAQWDDAVGLWCNDWDFVCGGSMRPWSTSTHAYACCGNAMDEAAREIVARLTGAYTGAGTGTQRHTFAPAGTAPGQDMAFVIDTTTSMADNLVATQANATHLAQTVIDDGGRVALVEYRDKESDFVARALTPLTSDPAAFRRALDALTTTEGAGGHNTDAPEDMLSGLMQAFDALEWQPGLPKAAVVLTDAGYHDPDRASGHTYDDVKRRALEIDPVNVYPVLVATPVGYASDPGAAAQLTALAQATGGQLVDATAVGAAKGLEQVTQLLTARPVVKLPLAAYWGQPGEEFRFDASTSYAVGAPISRFEWDFDADGTIDEQTTDPVTSHRYQEAFDGMVEVRAIAADGNVGTASATVLVTTESPRERLPHAPTDLTATVLDTATDGTYTIELTWTRTDERAEAWDVAVDGVPVGQAPATTTSVTVADVRGDAAVDFSVAGRTADGVGDATGVALESRPMAASTSGTQETSGTRGLPLVGIVGSVIATALLIGLGAFWLHRRRR
ncbi:cutinase family protein [Geodermatophilus sp. SYSU D01180]